MNKKLIFFALSLFLCFLPMTMMAQKQITLEDIWTKRTFAPSGVYGIRSMADGEHYCTMTRSGITKFEYATGERVEDVCLFSTPDMRLKAKPLPPMEGYEFSADEQKILLSSGFEPIYRHSGVSDYYLYDLGSKSFTKLTANGKQRLTTFSPDGTKVAFVRDNNLFWMDLATLEEYAITTDGKLNSIIYGTTDWVYEEEFAITKGFQWSPDSKKIAFFRFDESKVKEYNMQMWGSLYPDDYRYKYPKAGEDNSKVEVWVYDLTDGVTLKPQLGSERDQYLPRFQWADNNMLAVMRMNRLQNNMEIIAVNTETMAQTTIYDEQDRAYVEVPDTWQFIAVGKGKKSKQQLLLTSERDGFRHIYLYNMDGSMAKQITAGEWEVCDVAGVDAANQRLYYTSREDGSINKSLYVVGFDGKKKQCLNYSFADFDKLPKPAHIASDYANELFNGKYVLGTYNPTFSEGCKYYICSYSNANMAPVYTLHNGSGKLVKVLVDNASLQQKIDDYGAARKRFITIKTRKGDELNAYTILPPDFDSTKAYPLFFYVYGGPGNQQVSNSYGYSDYYWFHMLAQQGYVVACFDGRGTGGRGAAFKKQTYRDMGRMECEDAIEAAVWFGNKPWIDRERIGIFGWSFGGYLSTLSILKGNDVFKSAIAVAPVMNWRYYDNIYTERYLGLPKDNAKGYDENSHLNFADRLQGNYLLVHGTGDDNVHFQNSAEMVEKLENAGKQFEFRIYPNKNHSIYDATGSTRLNLYQMMTDFIIRKL